MAKRLIVRLPDDVYDEIVVWADKLGMSQAQLGGAALQSGLANILRAFNPLQGVPPEDVAKIAVAFKQAGLDVKMPEVPKGGQTSVRAARGTSARKATKAKSH